MEGSIALPQLSLDPGEIRLVNMSSFKLRHLNFSTAGLEINYTGAPGSVIASAYSSSANGDHVFALPLKDPQAIASSTGGYPWFIDDRGSTVIFIKNTTSEPRQFHLDVIYPEGMWGSNLRTIAPGQTFLLDVKAIRDAQIRGSEGNTSPLEASVGHVYWTEFGPTHKTLIGRSQIVNMAKRLVSIYECQVCMPSCYTGGYSDGRVIINPSTINVGGTAQYIAEQRDANCHSQQSSWFTVGAGWSSSNTNVATISGGIATGTGGGSATITATWLGQNTHPTGQFTCETSSFRN